MASPGCERPASSAMTGWPMKDGRTPGSTNDDEDPAAEDEEEPCLELALSKTMMRSFHQSCSRPRVKKGLLVGMIVAQVEDAS